MTFNVRSTDPLGPVAQDPEAVRTAACKLVASDASCTTVTISPPDDTRRPPSAATAGFDLVTLAFWIVLFVALVLVVIMIARAVARRESRPAEAEADDEVDPVVEEVVGVIVDRRREPHNWRREADRHRAAGRHRDALRCRYRALVGDLARRGLIDEIPGRTTGEERAQLHDVAPGAAASFDRAADLFDGVWYGDEPAGIAEDDAFVTLERDVLDATARVPT